MCLDLLILHADVDEIHHRPDHQQDGGQGERCLHRGDPAGSPDHAEITRPASFGSEPVAGAVDGANDASPELASQVVNVSVDGARRVDAVEYRFKQLTAGENLPRRAHQDAEQRRLSFGQFDPGVAVVAAGDHARHPVQAELADA